MRQLNIGFIGNFIPPFSTENDRKWSFERLGHKVLPFQENIYRAKDISVLAINGEIDLLLYSHTHGWQMEGIRELFESLKQMKIPTASVHLDRWAWLARESDLGKEATWSTEYLFMADFSPEAQDLYKKHGLNAHYLQPGVVGNGCYLAAPDPVRFPHEIIFVGSKGYHPEYPERPALIEFLHKTYGNRFGHYGNDGIRVVRGHDLNVLYATAKVAIGDSCFGGRPNYVSDRYYETRGRGGLLVHPFVEGVDNNGVFFYNPRDLSDLKTIVDHLLTDEDLMTEYRLKGFKHVSQHETYTHRAKEMLEVIFENE